VVACGGSQDYAIAANSCYSIADVVVDGVSQGPVSGYTFTNVQSNHTITASFSPNGPYTIESSAGTGGSITPNGSTSVACGGSQDYSIAANSCNSIADVVVDGVSQGPVSSYTFTNVQANHTITASFSSNGPYTIESSAGRGGRSPRTGRRR
jgi:phage-related protein